MNYEVSLNGKIIGSICREFPELYPDDWTIGLKILPYNHVARLNKCLAFISNNFPGVVLRRVE